MDYSVVAYLVYVNSEPIPNPGRHAERCAYGRCGHHDYVPGTRLGIFHMPKELSVESVDVQTKF
jgi:hypothetical protein